MSIEQEVNAKIDELSKPGNEADLNKTLNDAFNELGAAPSADPEAGQKKGEEDAPVEDDKGNKEEKGTGDGVDPKDEWPDILAERNAKKEGAANEQLKNTALEQQVAILTEQLAKVLNGKKGEAEPNGDAPAEDEPLTAKGILELLDKRDAEKNKTQTEKLASEKSEAEEVQKVINDKKLGDLAKPYEAKIREIVAKHKSISGIAALCMAIGMETIQGKSFQPEGSNKTATGNRGKGNLRKEKDAKTMTPKEQEAYLREEQAAGRLSI